MVVITYIRKGRRRKSCGNKYYLTQFGGKETVDLHTKLYVRMYVCVLYVFVYVCVFGTVQITRIL